MSIFPAFNRVLLALLILLLVAIVGVFKLSSNASYLVYFDKNAPLVKQYLDKKQRFNTNDSLILVLQSPDKSPLSKHKDFYRQSKNLIKNLKQLPEVNNINSFLTELRWRNNIFAKTKNKPKFLSADGTSALVFIDVKLNDNTDAKQILAFNNRVLSIAKRSYKEKKDTKNLPNTSSIKLYLSGALGLNNAYIETVRHDLKLFVPFLFFSMLLALMWLLKSIKIAFSMLGIGILSTLSSFGIIGWLGYPLASINIFTPIMIIGLSVVTNMHNTLAYYQYLAAGQTKLDALEQSFKDNLIPLSMSCLTTALGFLFLLNSSSPPIVVTGIASALGITFSLLLSLTLYQKLLFICAPNQSQTSALLRVNKLIPNLKAYLKCSKVIVLSSIFLLLVGIFGLTQLSINDNVYRYFPKDYDFRKSLNLIDEKFSGIVSIDYVLKGTHQLATTDSKTQVTTPLNQLTDQQWIQVHRFYKQLHSISTIKDIYPPLSLLNTDNINLFYNQQDTSKSPLETYIDKGGHNLRIQIRLTQMSSKQVLAIDKLITSWDLIAAQNLSTDNHALSFAEVSVSKGTSPDILFANVGYYNAISMFSSLGLALSIISAITGAILRSWRLCAVVFICNFFPILIAYGLLGLTGGYLTLGSTVVIGMIIGIIVDDTLHLLFKFIKYRNQYDTLTSLNLLHKRVFPAVIISSFIIVLALSIGLISDFKPTFEISFFSILVISLALLTDILLLPILLRSKWVNPQTTKEGII